MERKTNVSEYNEPSNQMKTVQHLPRDTKHTIGTTSKIISNELTTQQREAIIISNISAGGQIVTLGIGRDAVANTGIILLGGAIYHEVIDSEFKPTNAIITAIASGAGAVVSVHERISDITGGN
jgi:hypothetical protein